MKRAGGGNNRVAGAARAPPVDIVPAADADHRAAGRRRHEVRRETPREARRHGLEDQRFLGAVERAAAETLRQIYMADRSTYCIDNGSRGRIATCRYSRKAFPFLSANRQPVNEPLETTVLTIVPLPKTFPV